jgi:hypothetical protein
MKPELKIQAERLARTLEAHPALVFVFFLACNALLLWPTVLNQPIWDEAFSIFPAADFLARHGFDYRALLRQPGFVEAGPTTHGLTLPAFYTAVILKLTGGGKTAWCLLHVCQWLLGAGIGTMLVRLLAKTHEFVTALLLAALALYAPMMVTQVGNMYLEVPMLFFCVLALFLFLRGNIWGAALAAMLACATKESGFIAVIALAMTSALLERPNRKNFVTAIKLVVPSLALLLFLHWFQKGTGAGLALAAEPPQVRVWIFLVQAYKKYLALMPDMLVLFVVSLFLAAWLAVKLPWQAWRQRTPLEASSKLVFYCSLLVLGFTSFHFVVWALFADLSNFASRYLLFILPAMWILLDFAFAHRGTTTRARQWLWTAVLVMLLINRYGIFYPPLVTSDIGVAERSGENLDGFRVQQEYMRFLEQQIPPDAPIFHGLPEAYLGQYPVLGYVSKPLTNAVFISRFARTRPAKLDAFPERFYIVYFFPIVGSNELLGVYHEALKRPDWRTEDVASFIRGGFKAFVVLIERKKAGRG